MCWFHSCEHLDEAADADRVWGIRQDVTAGKVPGRHGPDHSVAGDDRGGGDGASEDQRARRQLRPPITTASGCCGSTASCSCGSTSRDPAVEEELYATRRRCVALWASTWGRRRVRPDETTICKFRHLLERNEARVRRCCSGGERAPAPAAASKISNGTIVDATIIGAPNARPRTRTASAITEMHQVAKGKQWYFGMKAHVGVDSKTKLIHTILASAARNVLGCGCLCCLICWHEVM